MALAAAEAVAHSTESCLLGLPANRRSLSQTPIIRTRSAFGSFLLADCEYIIKPTVWSE